MDDQVQGMDVERKSQGNRDASRSVSRGQSNSRNGSRSASRGSAGSHSPSRSRSDRKRSVSKSISSRSRSRSRSGSKSQERYRREYNCIEYPYCIVEVLIEVVQVIEILHVVMVIKYFLQTRIIFENIVFYNIEIIVLYQLKDLITGLSNYLFHDLLNRRNELEQVFSEFGKVCDVHIPRDYYSQ